MEHNDESSGRKSVVAVPPPFYIEDGGPLNYFIDAPTRQVDTKRKAVVDKWGLPDGVDIIKPANLDTVRFPPPNCIVVYVLS